MNTFTRRIFRKLRDKLILLFPNPRLPQNDQRSSLLIQRLRERIIELNKTSRISKSNIEEEWQQNLNIFREHVLTRDPRYFLRWGVILHTMFIVHASYTRNEWKFLMASKKHRQKHKNLLIESSWGAPFPSIVNPRTSANLIHHLYHQVRFANWSQMEMEQFDCIIEFGGGYGSMGRLCTRLGFKKDYAIFDLPEFSALQEFYLRGVNLIEASDASEHKPNYHFFSDIDALHSFISNRKDSESILFIATWSLSETPIPFRNLFEGAFDKMTHFLIGAQAKFGENDNDQYFEAFQDRRPNVEWQKTKEDIFPGNSFYLFGRPK
jgi:hypothetical protein